jgi:putative hydrolase of the HAD superfamily
LRPQNMWAKFLDNCPEKTNLMPHAIETLDYLTGKYPLYLITNGFIETQHRKLNNSGLDKYFKGFIISEETGFQKPMKEIYDLAVQKANITHHQSVMIGDSISADVEGALNAGLHAVYYNPDKLETEKPKKAVEIYSLLELTQKL